MGLRREPGGLALLHGDDLGLVLSFLGSKAAISFMPLAVGILLMHLRASAVCESFVPFLDDLLQFTWFSTFRCSRGIQRLASEKFHLSHFSYIDLGKKYAKTSMEYTPLPGSSPEYTSEVGDLGGAEGRRSPFLPIFSAH
jgi:hypothetical protein